MYSSSSSSSSSSSTQPAELEFLINAAIKDVVNSDRRRLEPLWKKYVAERNQRAADGELEQLAKYEMWRMVQDDPDTTRAVPCAGKLSTTERETYVKSECHVLGPYTHTSWYIQFTNYEEIDIDTLNIPALITITPPVDRAGFKIVCDQVLCALKCDLYERFTVAKYLLAHRE